MPTTTKKKNYEIAMEGELRSFLDQMLEHEIRRAERNAATLAIIMASARNGREIPKVVLEKTARKSDAFFQFEHVCVFLMADTTDEGALNAIERFCFHCGEGFDLRFSVAAFPGDGGTPQDLLHAAERRLKAAFSSTSSPVVMSD